MPFLVWVRTMRGASAQKRAELPFEVDNYWKHRIICSVTITVEEYATKSIDDLAALYPAPPPSEKP